MASMVEYEAFVEKVNRSVYIDNLSTSATDAVLRIGLDQFGGVVSVRFVLNYIGPSNSGRQALVEMQNETQAANVISTIRDYPFMISGMPRPVRALPAEIAMYEDRPQRPDRQINMRWVGRDDPDYQVAREIQKLSKKHAAEARYLLERQLQEEEQLARQQSMNLKSTHRKNEMLDEVLYDGTAGRLARHYNMNTSRQD